MIPFEISQEAAEKAADAFVTAHENKARFDLATQIVVSFLHGRNSTALDSRQLALFAFDVADCMLSEARRRAKP